LFLLCCLLFMDITGQFETVCIILHLLVYGITFRLWIVGFCAMYWRYKGMRAYVYTLFCCIFLYMLGHERTPLVLLGFDSCIPYKFHKHIPVVQKGPCMSAFFYWSVFIL
jgi:hypothetical protein